jgi:hypothetical protein
VHANRRDRLLYGPDGIVPRCHEQEETLHHLLVCPNYPASAHQTSSLQILEQHLKQAGTPLEVLGAGLHY